MELVVDGCVVVDGVVVDGVVAVDVVGGWVDGGGVVDGLVGGGSVVGMTVASVPWFQNSRSIKCSLIAFNSACGKDEKDERKRQEA